MDGADGPADGDLPPGVDTLAEERRRSESVLIEIVLRMRAI